MSSDTWVMRSAFQRDAALSPREPEDGAERQRREDCQCAVEEHRGHRLRRCGRRSRRAVEEAKFDDADTRRRDGNGGEEPGVPHAASASTQPTSPASAPSRPQRHREVGEMPDDHRTSDAGQRRATSWIVSRRKRTSRRPSCTPQWARASAWLASHCPPAHRQRLALAPKDEHDGGGERQDRRDPDRPGCQKRPGLDPPLITRSASARSGRSTFTSWFPTPVTTTATATAPRATPPPRGVAYDAAIGTAPRPTGAGDREGRRDLREGPWRSSSRGRGSRPSMAARSWRG